MYKTLFQAAFVAFIISGCVHATAKIFNTTTPTKKQGITITTTSGLQYRILKEGTGTGVTSTEKVLFHETVSYLNSQELYSTLKTRTPIATYFGNGQLIDGLKEGLIGMKVGETRELIIPPALNQPIKYPSFISPDSTLIYVIELKAFGVHKWYKETHSGSQPEEAGC